MVGFTEFKCDQSGNPNASRLCQHGSTCGSFPSPLDGRAMDVCICPDGYFHDFTAGHFYDCGVPSYALGVMFGVLTLSTIIAYVISIPIFFTLRSSAKRILGYALLQSLFSWAVLTAIWIERGHFQSASILLFVANVLLVRTQVEGTIIFSTPIYAMLRQSMVTVKRVIFGVEFFNMIGQLTLSIILIVYSKDVDVSRFNSTMIVFLFFMSINTIGLSFVMFRFSTRLMRDINETSMAKDDRKIAEFADRLKRMNNNHLLNLSFSCLLLVFPIVMLAIGTFPGQYILMFTMHAGVPYFLIQAAWLLRLDEAGKSLKKSETGSRDSKVNLSGGEPTSRKPEVQSGGSHQVAVFAQESDATSSNQVVASTTGEARS